MQDGCHSGAELMSELMNVPMVKVALHEVPAFENALADSNTPASIGLMTLKFSMISPPKHYHIYASTACAASAAGIFFFLGQDCGNQVLASNAMS